MHVASIDGFNERVWSLKCAAQRFQSINEVWLKGFYFG